MQRARLEFGADLHGLSTVPDFGLLTVDLRQLDDEGVARGDKLPDSGPEHPVFFRVETLDLVLPFADQPQRDRLHAAGADTAPDLFPEQRADLETDQPVEHAARLLGVDALHVELSGL